MKTNFIYAFRNIRNNSINSTITVVGLAVAIACCLIIYLFITQEYGFNRFYKNAERIYRVNYRTKFFDGDYKDVRIEPEFAEKLAKDIPQIEMSAEYRSAFEATIIYRNNYYDFNISLTSENFFQLFNYPFIIGNKADIFKDPFEIVITRKVAQMLVDSTKDLSSLMGKSVEFPLNYGDKPFKIVGIMENIPKNSSLNFDIIISGKTGRNFGGCDNQFGYTSAYYKIKENANVTEALSNVNKVFMTYYKPRIEQMQADNQLLKTNDAIVPFSVSLKNVYLRGDINNCFERSVEKRNFVILFTIGLLILIIACSNYTILSLGQYLKKIGDVGIRKAMGANVGNIFSVFLSEGILISAGSFILGAILCNLFIPIFGKLADAELYTELIRIKNIVPFIILLFLFISVFTSIVPVLVFSKVSPHQMAGKKITVGNKSILSQVFVSVQYSLSIILIIVTLFITKQSNYLKNRSLGLDSNNIINIRLYRIEDDKKAEFKELLKENPGVLGVTMVDRDFMNGSSNNYVNKGNGEYVSVFLFKVDPDYIPNLGLKMLRGKNFALDNVKGNNRSMIVNKKFVEAFGIEDDPIGRTYNISGSIFTIIGVVDDYHFSDLHSLIYPAMMHTRPYFGNPYFNILLKYHPKQLENVIKHIKQCYEKVAPGKTLTYDFWNERLQQRYQVEERWSKIIGLASLIAIIISSLGLFGLTVLLINQKVKEIGVRKVNGARTLEVVLSINRVFINWLIGSLIIAIPVSYYLVNKFLSYFPYRIDISWWVFILAGAIAFVIAFATVSWQSWRAANRNPVEALRYE